MTDLPPPHLPPPLLTVITMASMYVSVDRCETWLNLLSNIPHPGLMDELARIGQLFLPDTIRALPPLPSNSFSVSLTLALSHSLRIVVCLALRRSGHITSLMDRSVFVQFKWCDERMRVFTPASLPVTDNLRVCWVRFPRMTLGSPRWRLRSSGRNMLSDRTTKNHKQLFLLITAEL